MEKKELKKVAMDYLTRNEIRRSVIIFHHRGQDPVGCSTVVMPPDGANRKLVSRLIKAVSKVVGFDFISIDDLWRERDVSAEMDEEANEKAF